MSMFDESASGAGSFLDPFYSDNITLPDLYMPTGSGSFASFKHTGGSLPASASSTRKNSLVAAQATAAAVAAATAADLGLPIMPADSPSTPTSADFLELTAGMTGGMTTHSSSHSTAVPMALCSPANKTSGQGGGSVFSAVPNMSASRPAATRIIPSIRGRQLQGHSSSPPSSTPTPEHDDPLDIDSSSSSATHAPRSRSCSPAAVGGVGADANSAGNSQQSATARNSLSGSQLPPLASASVADPTDPSKVLPLSSLKISTTPTPERPSSTATVSSPTASNDEDDADASDNENDEQDVVDGCGDGDIRKVRNKRACMACYKAKTKCSPALPCVRCKRLMIECKPREHRRRKRRTITPKPKNGTHVGPNGFVHGEHCAQNSQHIVELKSVVASLQQELYTYKLALASASIPSPLNDMSSLRVPINEIEGAGGGSGHSHSQRSPTTDDLFPASSGGGFPARKRQRGANSATPTSQTPHANRPQSPSAFLPPPRGSLDQSGVSSTGSVTSPPHGVTSPSHSSQQQLQQLLTLKQAQQQQHMLAQLGLKGSMFPDLALGGGGLSSGLSSPADGLSHHTRPHSQSFNGPFQSLAATGTPARSGALSSTNNGGNGGGVIIGGNPKAPRAHSTPPSMQGAAATLLHDPNFAASLRLPMTSMPPLNLDSWRLSHSHSSARSHSLSSGSHSATTTSDGGGGGVQPPSSAEVAALLAGTGGYSAAMQN